MWFECVHVNALIRLMCVTVGDAPVTRDALIKRATLAHHILSFLPPLPRYLDEPAARAVFHTTLLPTPHSLNTYNMSGRGKGGKVCFLEYFHLLNLSLTVASLGRVSARAVLSATARFFATTSRVSPSPYVPSLFNALQCSHNHHRLSAVSLAVVV